MAYGKSLGKGSVSREEVADVVERSMAGNEKKVATTVRVALGVALGGAVQVEL
jgi:hypothetical protein